MLEKLVELVVGKAQVLETLLDTAHLEQGHRVKVVEHRPSIGLHIMLIEEGDDILIAIDSCWP